MVNNCENQIKVSVIVLTYNHEKYIREALDSILMQQTSYQFEILIGDDASTDGTSDIVCEYEKKYPDIVHAYIRENNLGATDNLYRLLEVAKGEYIASCEGDDYWTDPYKLQTQIDYLDCHPYIMGCTHLCHIVDEDRNELDMKLKWISEKENYTLKDFKGYILPGHPATLVHRNFFLDKGHDFSIIKKANSMVADRTIVFILLLYGEIHQIKKTMSAYRIRNREKSENVTVMLFENNPDSNLMQYQLTKRLEEYAGNEFGQKIVFRKFKLEQCIKFVVKKIIGRVMCK